MANRAQAERIVKGLAKQYGYLDKEMMDAIGAFNPEYRRTLEESFTGLEDTAAHSIKTLAKHIYGSGARFVFELLQNAEDNKYTKAISNGQVPYVLFKHYPTHIVVECNEDGFKEADMNAICAVGKSTKSSSYGYIGAKGIGFKSVFIAAWRVIVQSGYFSFEFNHRKHDPGLGMVRPLWIKDSEYLGDKLTRLTLYFHDNLGSTDSKHLRQTIEDQFTQLEPTCLLFLKKLQKVDIEFYDNQDRLIRSRRLRKSNVKNDQYCVQLDTETFENGQDKSESRIYHIARTTAINLPLSDGRDVSSSNAGAQNGPAGTTAEVVLAFPLTPKFEPDVRQNEHLFAFLPMKKSDYKFLIQSDFDTDAGRGDIVVTSRRNIALRSSIAAAFIQGVLQFCQHDKLCYTWPVFLPSLSDSYPDFWTALNEKLSRMIQDTPVLKARNGASLRKTSKVMILPKNARDENGEPLLDSPHSSDFISPSYSNRSLKRLKEYGLHEMWMSPFYRLLRADLDSPQPKMHQASTSKFWHSAMAELLYEYNTEDGNMELFTLRLIPLRNGKWVSANSTDLHLPRAGGVEIPKKLDIKVVDPEAASDSSRQKLFVALGVEHASVATVRTSIFKAFRDAGRRSNVLWEAYVHFLYQTHLLRPDSETTQNGIYFVNEDNVLRDPLRVDMYLRSDQKHRYGPDVLLSPTANAPGLPVHFVSWTKGHEPPKTPSSNHPTWERWLYDRAGIREHLRLLSADGTSLSAEFKYVLEHRTEDFLGYLQHNWKHEGRRFRKNEKLVQEVRQMSAQELCGVNTDISLGETWLPKTEIRDAVTTLMDRPEDFPLLKLPDSEWSDQSTARWKFLKETFSVRGVHDIDLLLDILHHTSKSELELGPTKGYKKTFELYKAIYGQLMRSGNSDEERRVKAIFVDKEFTILIPRTESNSKCTWTDPQACVWKGPPGMNLKYDLHGLYSKLLGEDQLDRVGHLMQDILGILPITAAQLVQELKASACEGDEDFEKIRGFYKYLQKTQRDQETMSRSFREDPMVYVRESQKNEKGWYKTADCLWSSSTPIHGKAVLEEDYPDLKSLFVDELDVRSLTLEMVYDELKDQDWGHRIDELKSTITSFSSFLSTETSILDFEALTKASIFPVSYKGGSPAVKSIGTPFFIADRLHLKEKFESQATLLDFDLEQVRRLAPFFRKANLEHLYLSNCVQESTSVSGEYSRPISSRNRDLKRKAYYILRVAATFASPRYEESSEGLYQLLRTMRVIETNGLVSTLRLKHGSELIECEEDAGTEHIEYSATALTIYVPRKKRAQEVCFGDALPTKMAHWLLHRGDSEVPTSSQSDKTELVSALKTVLACDRAALDEILSKQGILQVPIENEDEPDDDGSDSESADEFEQQEGLHLGSGGRTDSPTNSSPQETPGSSVATYEAQSEGDDGAIILGETVSAQSRLAQQNPRLAASPHTPPSSSRSNVVPVVSPPRNADDSLSSERHYLSILSNVVSAARQAGFPVKGAFDMSDMRQALPAVESGRTYEGYDGLEFAHTRFKSASQLERDMKIGAAGELYVFEVLSTLGLPNWDRRNWQSNIRPYVGVHPDYTGLRRWGGRETADLVYQDTEGQLTRMLIEYGYLTWNEWSDARPKYYLEVKTTTGPLATPFYVSNNQFKLMKQVHERNDRSEVYMVLRVHSVGGASNDIKMSVYLDPEQLRQQGSLVFTAPTWSVVPEEEL